MRKKLKKSLIESAKLMLSAMALTLLFYLPVFAAGGDGAAIVKNGFNVIYTIIAAVVSSIGTLFLLWGLFEWAQSLNSQDGGAQSIAFKRVGSGLVATLGPQLIPIISNAINA
jgi:hypothetical protein